MTDCQLTKRLIREWARERAGPFPYLEVGEHLKGCLSCLSWSTGIAFSPADRYSRALRLKLSDVLGYLGSSLLAVWSSGQDVKISFCLEPDTVPRVKARALKFIERYRSFSPDTAREAEAVREMIGHADAGSGLARLEPYELVRYFFAAALQMAPESEARLSLLVNLGITENYQALNERAAGHEAGARRHFSAAREQLARVLATDVREYKGMARPTRESDKTALISARVNLAGTEVQQDDYSEVSLHKAVGLLHEALRLVPQLGLQPEDFTAIYSNLMIAYLRLFLSHGLSEGLTQAQRLAETICAEPVLARAFLDECIRKQADPELTRLLKAPQVSDLAAFLAGQAGDVKR
jgi:hypothetical protein